MALRHREQARAHKVSGELELVSTGIDGKVSLRQTHAGENFFQAVDSVKVGGSTHYVMPERGLGFKGLIFEGLTHISSDANSFDRELARTYQAVRIHSNRLGEHFLLPFCHGVESELLGSARSVVGGHIQFQNDAWRRQGKLDIEKVIEDSQRIRSFAMPFLYVDASVERVCRKRTASMPSDMLYKRQKMKANFPLGDDEALSRLRFSDDLDMMFSAEPVGYDTLKRPIHVTTLEVRCTPSGPAMGKHALDILVAAGQKKIDGGFNFTMAESQNMDPWGSLRGSFDKMRRDIPTIDHHLRFHGIESLEELRRRYLLISLDVGLSESGSLRKYVEGTQEHPEFAAYKRTAFDATRFGYKAEVTFNGEGMLLRDAYALHYLENRKIYDSADPAVHEWVRSATDNGFSYTDFRFALRGFFQNSNVFNRVVGELTKTCFTLDEKGERHTMSFALANLKQKRGMGSSEKEFIEGLSVFLDHRYTGKMDEGAVPYKAEVSNKTEGKVRVRVPAGEKEAIGDLLDAGFMFTSSGRMADGRGFFELEYNIENQRPRKAAEGLKK